MARFPPLSLDEINRRLFVDLVSGYCYWKDATKHHRNLEGKLAGHLRIEKGGNGGYWIIKINGVPYKRAQIVLAISTGKWPNNSVDHINGNKTDDRAANLRHATTQQNNWNHRSRAKKEDLPMGIRSTASGRFQARIACNNKQFALGTFDTIEAAISVYKAKRKELFNEYSGL